MVVTGATGFIGRALVTCLQELGFPLRLFCRNLDRLPPTLDRNEIEVVTGDLGDPEALNRAVTFATPALVVHLAAATEGNWEYHRATTIEGTRRLIDAGRRAGVRRFIHISSMSVYDFSALPAGSILTETGPLETDTSRRNAYAWAKAEADAIARAALEKGHPEVCILRPGIVYGPGGRMPLITTLKRLSGRYFVSIGGGKRPLPLTYLDNLVDAIVLALTHPRAAGRIFNVVDDIDVPIERRYLEELHAIQRVPVRIVGVPVAPVLAVAHFADLVTHVSGRKRRMALAHGLRRVTNPIAFSSALLKQELGWRPRVGFAEGLVRTLSASPQA